MINKIKVMIENHKTLSFKTDDLWCDIEDIIMARVKPLMAELNDIHPIEFGTRMVLDNITLDKVCLQHTVVYTDGDGDDVYEFEIPFLALFDETVRQAFVDERVLRRKIKEQEHLEKCVANAKAKLEQTTFALERHNARSNSSTIN